MGRILRCCGIVCSECKSYPTECAGCPALKGRVFWLDYVDADICPVYKCCLDKAVEHCGKCGEMPCERWTRYKDPNVSEEEGAAEREKRAAFLRQREESGE